jgi:Xaa-Pro aminopeptidase
MEIMENDGIRLAEYHERHKKVQRILDSRGIDVLVAFGSESEPQNLIYLASYWPAFETSSAVIPREGSAALAIGPETKTFAEDSGVMREIFQVLEHRESSEPNYPNQQLATYEDIFDAVLGGRRPRRIGIAGTAFIAHPVYEAIVRAARGAEILKADDILIGLRMKKSDHEIRLLRQSSAITLKAFEAGIQNIRAGMEEVEVAAHIIGAMFAHRAENAAYTPYVLSGNRTNQAISRPSHRIIGRDEPIQFSFGCKYQGYASSIGRPLCIGRMPQKYRELVDVGLGAQELVIASMKPGIPAKEIFKKYWDYLVSREAAESFLYGPCHGTGIMECEHPFLEADSGYLLEEGMTFQVDIFLADRSFGLRFEDGALITSRGAEAFNNEYRRIIEL